jgi:hypothetical protein
MRISSANSVCSARIANSLSGCSRAAHDFLGMSCVLERVVPRGFCRRATAVTSLLSLRVCVCFALFYSHAIVMFVVRANFVGKKKEKKLTKNSYHKKLLNISRAISYKKPDMRPVPVLSDYLVKLVIPAYKNRLSFTGLYH